MFWARTGLISLHFVLVVLFVCFFFKIILKSVIGSILSFI